MIYSKRSQKFIEELEKVIRLSLQELPDKGITYNENGDVTYIKVAEAIFKTISEMGYSIVED